MEFKAKLGGWLECIKVINRRTSLLTATGLWSKSCICIPDEGFSPCSQVDDGMTSARKGHGHMDMDLSECINHITLIFKNWVSILPSPLLIPIPFVHRTGISFSIRNPFESHSFWWWRDSFAPVQIGNFVLVHIPRSLTLSSITSLIYSLFPGKVTGQICDLLWDPSAGFDVDTSWSQMLHLFPRGHRSDCSVLPARVTWWTPWEFQNESAAERKNWKNFDEARCGEGTFISRGWRSSLSQFSFFWGVLLIHFPCPHGADLWIQTGDLLRASHLLCLLHQQSSNNCSCLPRPKLCLQRLLCLYLEVCHTPARHIMVTK